MRIEELLKEKRIEIIETAAKHGVHNVRVFGSVARGEAGPESDLDILVELEVGRSLLDHVALLLDLQKLLGINVDMVTEKGLKARIKDDVLNEAVAL